MNDAVRDKERQAAREFKIGILLLAVLFCVFIGVAYRRYRMSFSDPNLPTAAVVHATDSADATPFADDVSHLDSSRAEPPLPGTGSWQPPAYEESRDSAFQIAPPLPPPSELAAETGDDAALHSEQSGGSYQLESDSSQGTVETADAFIPAAPVRDSRHELAPATIELVPPNLTEPATFQQSPDHVEPVQRTQFQNSAAQYEPPGVGVQPESAPPLTLAVDDRSKPIDQFNRVEPIRADDSFWLISQRAYGDGGYFRALYEHNRERFPEPDRLPVGAPVEIPSTEYLRQRFPDFCPKADDRRPQAESPSSASERIYTAVGGESLFDVARFQLGQGSRYVEILELNGDGLKEHLEALPAGLRLRLPPR